MSNNIPRQKLLSLKSKLMYEADREEDFCEVDAIQTILENYVIVPKERVLDYLQFETIDVQCNRSQRKVRFVFTISKEGTDKIMHNEQCLKIIDEELKKEIIACLELG